MDLVLIPAYEPDQVLIGLAKDLTAEGFSVLVVDDGSGRKYADIFQAVSQYATVITQKRNGGKGSALKTGMRYIKEKLPQCEHFITCDADGQHQVCDVLRVRDMLHKGEHFVLTVRQKNKKAPFRSRFGNSLSRFVYTILTRRYLSDNQSGLRGFQRKHLDWMLEVEKNNYDYEMNVLYYAAKKGLRIATLPIASIYIDNNASSHFNPVVDTIKIYKSLFSLAGGTLISFLAAEVTIAIVSIIFGYQMLFITLPLTAAGCYLLNILLDHYVFFRTTPRYDYWSMLVYTILAYFIYTLCCSLAHYVVPGLPLWFAFNIIYLFYLPLRYILHKFIYIASKTAE